MSSFFKKTACVTGIILLGLFGLIGFYSTTLPDFYLVSKGSELSVNSFFTISSKPCESKVTVAVSGGSSGASRYTKNMLILFGAVPVKEVESKTMERPMLYPCGQPFGIKLLTEGVMVVDLLTEALVNARYSQKQECAADDYGYEFLKKAGKNPWAMALSFQKLKSLQEQSGGSSSSKLNQLFSTHPDLDLRIKRMEERATSEGIEKPVEKTAE